MGLTYEQRKELQRQLGNTIQRRRETLGVSQEWVAEMAGVPLAYVKLIESGDVTAPMAIQKIQDEIFMEQQRRNAEIRSRQCA
jgi:predicted transcriptional regulator